MSHEFIDDLLSNRTFSAMAREDEAGAVKNAVPPVDLRAVPREQWDTHLQHDVTLPPAVISYLDGRTEPLNGTEADMLADQVAAFHGVSTPWFIVCTPEMQRTGRAWAHLPELAPLVTGFYLDKATTGS